MNITIDPEFRDLIPPLAPEEFDQLEKSVVGQGILSPLLVWKEEQVLIDGHNRHKICTEFKKPFPTKELSFDDREQVKRFIILNQLGRRNVTPQTAEVLRGKYHESMKMAAGSNLPQNNLKGNNCPLENTAEVVAKQTGVSARTVKTDAQLVRALKKLGISEQDYMSGKIKRSKKSIISEAFPPKVKDQKPKQTKQPEPFEGTTLDVSPEEITSIMDSIVIEDEEPQPPKKEIPLDQDPWLITLKQLPKLTKEQRQELFLILQSRWDCKPAQS